ncbi:MAG: OmpA family protein [Endozoicomonas sp. (ex Botrylloides leachii)]|nr:OmpA family protein [Endozoicomonas sp. (ex Botrylloides leachii)]
MKALFKQTGHEQDEAHWLSISDLMAGLMMVFLFISIALMRDAFSQKNKMEAERDTMKKVAIAYENNQVAIYNALNHEFKKDLSKWDASINEKTLTFTFQSPDVLFKTGKIDLSSTYKNLLNDFFPRYLKVLKPFQSSISEIRIEGHTSSVWNRHSTPEAAYFNNMALSQGRTRSVLAYVYNLPGSYAYRGWIKSHIAAVGLSSSKPIYLATGKEDRARSRRVSFRVMTNADIQIKRILEAG